MNLIYFVYLRNNSWRQYCRTVTCYALDVIFVLYFVKDDKMCVHNDRNESDALVSVYIHCKTRNKYGDYICEEPGLCV